MNNTAMLRFGLVGAMLIALGGTQNVPAKPPWKVIKQKEQQPKIETLVKIDDKKLPKSFNLFTRDKFIDTYVKGVPEKLYLHLDKPYYCAGEKIWFKGYLVNAVTFSYPRPTQFIYVELIDRQDSVIKRIKVKADEKYEFHNSLELPAELPGGDYLLRGYTQWMRNDGEDYFFRKIIPISNPIDDNVNVSVGYFPEKNGDLTVKYLLKDAGNHPIADLPLRYELAEGEKIRKYTAETDSNGEITIQVDPLKERKGKNTLRLVSNEPKRVYDHTFVLPEASIDFDIQFMPEGGHLLPLGQQVVAFKAVGVNGLSTEVTGKVYDNTGRLITEIASIHKGMGRFSFTPKPDESYHVEVTSQDGMTKQIKLPKVEQSGCSLTVTQWRRIMCYISITRDINPERLALVVLCRGKIMAAEEFRKDEWFKTATPAYLMPGICHIMVIDRTTRIPLAERLFFVKDHHPATVKLKTNKEAYKPRQKINLTLQLTNYRDVPAYGSYSISVTDRNLVQQSEYAENINSYLLMSSDLKGYIEEPGYYFSNNNPQTDSKLDLLMLTQGWTRFNITEIMNNIHRPRPYLMENVQLLAGHVEGLLSRSAKQGSLILTVFNTGFAKRFPLEDHGKFAWSADFEDSTVFGIQALNKREGIRGIALNMKRDTFPPVRNIFFPTPLAHAVKPVMDTAYPNNFKQQYTFEGGRKIIRLPDVTVSARKEKEEKMHIFDNGTYVSRIVAPRTLKAFIGSTVYDLINLQALPGVRIDEIMSPEGRTELVNTWRSNRTGPVKLVVVNNTPHDIVRDGIHEDTRFLQNIQVGSVESIGLIMPGDPEATRYGFRGNGGVIMIKLKQGEDLNLAKRPTPSFTVFTPLGYKKPNAFYAPRYETAAEKADSRPDLRTTIYWNPSVELNKNGFATFSFYGADRPAEYDVVLEGVTLEGQPVHYTTTIGRAKE